MNKKVLLSVFISLFTIGLFAQTEDPVLMKINNRPIKKSEFEYLYKKNNSSTQQSFDEYMDLFINYKLKVEEAIAQGLDTTSSFVSEYNGYKKQIVQPYLSDSVSLNIIAKKVYDRLGENIDVSHVFVRMPQKKTLLPSDTVEAYNKIISIREKLTDKKGKKSFEEIALEFSEDPSVSQTDRPGNLGWATAMMFFPQFEDVMYTTAKGDISMPVRIPFGYNVLKVNERRADPGRAKISHILFRYPSKEVTPEIKDSVRKSAENVYAKLLAGDDFIQLCETYSTDPASAKNGGNIGWIDFSMRRMPKSILEGAFELKNVGNFSAPVETMVGYSILRLDEKAEREPFEKVKGQLADQIKNSYIMEEVDKLEKERLGKQFGYKLEDHALAELKILADIASPYDSLYLARIEGNKKTLLTVADKKYTVADFKDYYTSNKENRYPLSTDLLGLLVNNFTLAKLKDAYAGHIEKELPECSNLLNEYYDGILLFNIMNDNIWESTANDEQGLEKYFKENKSKYTWDSPRYKGYIVYYQDESKMKEIKKIAEKNKKAADLGSILETAFNNDSIKMVAIKRGVWTKGENRFIDNAVFKSQEEPEPVKNYPYWFVVGETITSPQEYTDVKGLVVSDLQEIREKEWIQDLRKKYPVEINESVLKTIK